MARSIRRRRKSARSRNAARSGSARTWGWVDAEAGGNRPAQRVHCAVGCRRGRAGAPVLVAGRRCQQGEAASEVEAGLEREVRDRFFQRHCPSQRFVRLPITAMTVMGATGVPLDSQGNGMPGANDVRVITGKLLAGPAPSVPAARRERLAAYLRQIDGRSASNFNSHEQRLGRELQLERILDHGCSRRNAPWGTRVSSEVHFMGLVQYRNKRNFRRTPEPRGRKTEAARKQLSFVIQKHDASHLHYDFRLELGGVLKSWAVPKGPDLDPANKRLAMQVEDHPLEYGGFEGTIPEGEYGGGTVMLWDKGVWEPLGDAKKGYFEGHLKFNLHGEKLQGAWMLVRKGGRKSEPDERRWFLFKERDEYARPGESITDEMPLSVTTGRNLEEIASELDRVWGPNGETSKPPQRAAKPNGRAGRAPRKGESRNGATNGKDSPTVRGDKRRARIANDGSLGQLLEESGARRSSLPTKPSVELATLVDEAPTGDLWVNEIKFDGYRMLCRLARGKAAFISRNGNDWTKKFPDLAKAAGELEVADALLDGEVVAFTSDGTTSFQALQNIFQSGRTNELVYYVFDILHLNGHDLTPLPLELRKTILKQAMAGSPAAIRYSDYIQGSGKAVIEKACQLHLEGIICKRRDSGYRPGRGLDWLKVKCSKREEFVIGGFTKPGGNRSHFGALLLGYHGRNKKFVYAGRVGTGFNDTSLRTLHQKLGRLIQTRSPFSDLTGTTGEARDVSWVKPSLVAEIQFSNWTDDGLLRHPSFQGLREDKPAAKVFHDEPMKLSEVKATQNHKEPATRKERVGRTALPRKPAAGKGAGGPSDAEVADVRLTHPDKVLYPDRGITKHDLATYYSEVAEWMLPHVAHRPLAVVRCPEGSTKACFFQKHPGEKLSEHLLRVNISQQAAPEYNLMIEDLSGLISLVQIGVLEIHVWGSRAKTLEKPDRLIFDLDPDPQVVWSDVISAAKSVRAVLQEFELDSFLKTTGGTGLHIVVPIQPRTGWDEAKAFCPRWPTSWFGFPPSDSSPRRVKPRGRERFSSIICETGAERRRWGHSPREIDPGQQSVPRSPGRSSHRSCARITLMWKTCRLGLRSSKKIPGRRWQKSNSRSAPRCSRDCLLPNDATSRRFRACPKACIASSPRGSNGTRRRPGEIRYRRWPSEPPAS